MKRIFLSIFLFIILVLYYGCSYHNDTEKQDNEIVMNPKFYSELSKILNEDFIYKTPFANDSLSIFKYFFVLKFFNRDTNLYFSLWVQPFFPSMNKTDIGWVWTDTNNLYYYCINGNSLVIIDYPSSQGYGLYQTTTNKQAITVMQYSREFYIPRCGELNTPCITYSIIGKDSFERILPMLPLKYENEKE